MIIVANLWQSRRTRSTTIVILAVLCVAIAMVVYIAQRPSNESSIRTLIKQLVPEGTPVDVARERMENRGFDCSVANGPAAGIDSGEIISCIKLEGAWYDPVKTKWSVIIGVENGRTTNVRVDRWLVGP